MTPSYSPVELLCDVFQNFRFDEIEKCRFVCSWWTRVIQGKKDHLPRIPPKPEPWRHAYQLWLKENYGVYSTIYSFRRKTDKTMAEMRKQWVLEVPDKSRYTAMTIADQARYNHEMKTWQDAQEGIKNKILHDR